MAKDAYYFSHDSNARNDHKLMLLRMSMGGGMHGYGIYFGIIEMLREADGYKLPLNFEAIAFDLRESVENIRNVVMKFDLFKISEDGNFFESSSLVRRMEHLDSIRVNRKKAGRKGGLAKARANAKQMLSSKVKESKVNESKEKEINKELKDQAAPPPLKDSIPPKPTDPRAVDLKGVVVEYGGQVLGEPSKHKLHNQLILLFQNRGWDCALIRSVMAACAERLLKAEVQGDIYPYYEKIIAKYINENSEALAAQNKRIKNAQYAGNR